MPISTVPVIVMGATGPMDPTRRRPHIDWIHTAIAQGQAVRDFTKWDYQPVGAEDVVDSFAWAWRIATSEPYGPVYLCCDAGFQEDPLEEAPSIPPPRQVQPTRIHPDPQALDRLAQWLVEAERPLLLAEYTGRHPEAMPQLAALAEFLGAPVVDRGERLCFPNRHPLNLTGRAEAVLAEADLVVALDVRDLHGAISTVNRVTRRTQRLLPPGCRLVEVGFGDLGIRSWSQELHKLQPVDLSLLADTSTALAPLLERCRARATAQDRERFRERSERYRALHDQLFREWVAKARERAEETPVATGYLVQEVGEAIRDADWVLTANTVRDWAKRLWDFARPDRHPGNHFGTATQIGIFLGVALAYRGTDRLVVNLQPDGDLLFDAGALWTAAYHHIPLLVVMYNNRAYYNDWEHQILMARERGRDEQMAYLGMEIDRPAPDFAALARAFGWYSEGPIERPQDVRPAVARAREVVLRERRPALVDVVTQHR